MTSESSAAPGTPLSVGPGMTDIEYEENREPPPLTYAEKLRMTQGPDWQMNVRERSRKRIPRSAAVGIKLLKADFSFADIIRKARAEVSLTEFGIADTRIRRTANGNLLIEVFGPESSGKADKLADRLRSVLEGDALVTRPVIRADLRLTDLDESVSPQEIIEAVTREGECSASDIRLGPIVPLRSGLGRTWVRCPLQVADRIADAGKIRIGWSSVRAESPGAGPLQCFKCWNYGHVRGTCKSTLDRTGHCFGCGGSTHSIRECSAAPRCVVCADAGYQVSHRLGSAACESKRHFVESAKFKLRGRLGMRRL